MTMTAQSKTDRYVTFRGINCTEYSVKVMEHIYAIIDDPEKTNPFWEQFKQRVTAAGNVHARVSDELCLLCAFVSVIEELFEEHEDEAGMAHLRRLEYECC
jgi:hypothetical protein